MMRNLVRVLAGIVLVLAVLWGGTWWYVQERLRDGLLNYAARNNTEDGSNTLSYGSITTGTNPFTASAAMNDVRWTVKPPAPAAPMVITYAQTGLSIDMFNPLVLHLLFPNRLDISASQGSVSVTFGNSSGSARLDPRALFNRQVYPLTNWNDSAQDISVLADGAIEFLHIDGVSTTGSIHEAATPDQTALVAHESADNISLPHWVVSKWQLPFDGKVNHLQFDLTASGPCDWSALVQQISVPQLNTHDKSKALLQAVHDWAAKGGNAKASLVLAIGPTTLNASTNVAFDSNAQPSGTANVTANHLDSFTAALTTAYPPLQQSIAGLEGRYSSYLTTNAADGQALNLHIAYSKDGVLVNGARVADMPPIDWNALENASVPDVAPPVPQASGDGSGAASP